MAASGFYAIMCDNTYNDICMIVHDDSCFNHVKSVNWYPLHMPVRRTTRAYHSPFIAIVPWYALVVRCTTRAYHGTMAIKRLFIMCSSANIIGTRRFSNHESHLLPWLHTCAIIVILDLTPYLLRWEKGHWPLDDLWPHICEVTCVTLSKDHRVQVPLKYIKVCGYSDRFCKNLNQRSLTPRWPLTPHLLRSHVWLYPRIIVSKSHENTSKYVDIVTVFAKTWTKGRWLLNDLWPHICWGHVCDSTQGSLCPSRCWF